MDSLSGLKNTSDRTVQDIKASVDSGNTEDRVKLLIFRIDAKKYAVFAHQVREIVLNHDLFFIPFVPPYIRGFINRLGNPYTVFDINVIFNHQELDAHKFLILNLGEDHVAILVTDVESIHHESNSKIHRLTAHDDSDPYYLGSVPHKEENIFILNLQTFMDRLQHDLQSIQ